MPTKILTLLALLLATASANAYPYRYNYRMPYYGYNRPYYRPYNNPYYQPSPFDFVPQVATPVLPPPPTVHPKDVGTFKPLSPPAVRSFAPNR